MIAARPRARRSVAREARAADRPGAVKRVPATADTTAKRSSIGAVKRSRQIARSNVPVHLRRSPWSAILICAALALALLVPLAASASASGGGASSKQTIRAQRRADREAQREARATQRSARHSAKQATREATRSERQAEREARRAAREAERTNGSHTTEAPSSTEPAGVEPAPGEAGQKAPTEGVVAAPIGARPSLTPRAGCSLTVTPSAAQVTVGESVTLSGKLSCPAGIEVSGQEVTIDQRQAPASGVADTISSSLAPVDTAVVAEDGSYEFRSAALSTRSTFVVRFSGARHNARTVVRVNAGVTLESSATSGAPLAITAGKAAGGPSRVTFSGVVQPAAAGIGVGLRIRYAGQQWRTVAFAHTDAEGHYSFSHRFRVGGEVEVATVAHPHGEQRTESTPLSYTIVSGSSSPGANQGSSATPTPTPAVTPPVPTTPTPTSPTSTAPTSTPTS
jgi:hypothetical protein